jgi:type IV pilus assembly protein PilB
MGDRPKRVGDLLVEHGYVTRERVEEAARQQVHRNERLCTILIEMGDLTERDLVHLVANHLRVPHMDLDGYELDIEVIKYIPPEFAKRHQVVPVDRMGGMLSVAVVYPLSTEAVRELENMTRLAIKQVVCPKGEIERVIRSYYEMTLPGLRSDF